jgi:hypothetical protein
MAVTIKTCQSEDLFQRQVSTFQKPRSSSERAVPAAHHHGADDAGPRRSIEDRESIDG